MHVFLGRPLFLLSRGIHSIINFGILSYGILLTWPYHCSLFCFMTSMMFGFLFTSIISLICSFFILSIFDFLADLLSTSVSVDKILFIYLVGICHTSAPCTKMLWIWGWYRFIKGYRKTNLTKNHLVLQVGSWCSGPEEKCINLLTPNDHYSGRTAPLTSKRCILYIYSTNTGTEYFKHGIYCPFFFSSKCSLFHNSNVFCFCFIHILYTGCAKI